MDIRKIGTAAFAGMLALAPISAGSGNESGMPTSAEMIDGILKPLTLRNMGELKSATLQYAAKGDDEATRKSKKEATDSLQKYERAKEKAMVQYRRDGTLTMEFHTYRVKKGDVKGDNGFLTLAAQLDQQQWTLATANGIESVEDLAEGAELVLPAMQGVFVADEPGNEFEILVKKQFEAEILADAESRKWIPVTLGGRRFKFLPDSRFSGTTMAFFHDKGMKLPLPTKVLTSPFGYRTSPISGQWKLHAGIDLAAPVGTPVTACKGGTVKTAEQMNAVYGNYVVIDHGGGKTSTYAHLKSIDVRVGTNVGGGQKIGEVGMTGMTTGPHLHFEIREKGTPIDPLKQLK